MPVAKEIDFYILNLRSHRGCLLCGTVSYAPFSKGRTRELVQGRAYERVMEQEASYFATQVKMR